MNQIDLRNRRAVVTGGARGIGYAIATRLLQSGASVSLWDMDAEALMKAAQALALFDGLEFVTPEQIQELAVPVIAHRIVMEPQARFSGLTSRGVVEEIVKKIKVPA